MSHKVTDPFELDFKKNPHGNWGFIKQTRTRPLAAAAHCLGSEAGILDELFVSHRELWEVGREERKGKVVCKHVEAAFCSLCHE